MHAVPKAIEKDFYTTSKQTCTVRESTGARAISIRHAWLLKPKILIVTRWVISIFGSSRLGSVFGGLHSNRDFGSPCTVSALV
jgi:hypothetical protein